jgi:hypothetical protein
MNLIKIKKWFKANYLKALLGTAVLYSAILSVNKFSLAYGYLNKLTISDECINYLFYNGEVVSISWYYGLILNLFGWGYIWAFVFFALLILFFNLLRRKK